MRLSQLARDQLNGNVSVDANAPAIIFELNREEYGLVFPCLEIALNGENEG